MLFVSAGNVCICCLSSLFAEPKIGLLSDWDPDCLSCPLPPKPGFSGYECGRVFPAGVGPGSPSIDAAYWLPSRFGLSVETRRRYGWLRIVFPGLRLFRAPIWCPLGGWRHARGREHCRGEPGSSLSGGYAPVSVKAEGSSIVDEPGEG